MDYGNRIYKLRRQKGLSQEEVANELGVSRQSISLWETNQASPSMENLIAMQNYLIYLLMIWLVLLEQTKKIFRLKITQYLSLIIKKISILFIEEIICI